ncbi:hypothetical protein C0J52_00962 [Blattella germanica]|nr:hypothetical protein C0J52_00962 [Blattella germanica]
MLFKMSESNVTQTCVKTEVGRTLRSNLNEGDHFWAEGQGMGPIATKLDGSNNSEDITYYGISIPKDVNVNGSEGFLHVYTDKTEALKVVKKFKKARFKAFKTRHDAVKFAIYGSEILTVSSPTVGENLDVISSPVVGEKPSPFKGPKNQDLVRLRRIIECGDIPTFRFIVWDNPRYLVSSGDTPAILQVFIQHA